MRKIVIDISQVAYEGSGVARYTQHLVEALVGDEKNQYIFLFCALRRKLPENIYEIIKNSPHVLIKKPIPPRLLEFLWNSLQFPSLELLIGQNFDLYISSDSAQAPTKAKKLTVIHDVIYKLFPDVFPDQIIGVQTRRYQRLIADKVDIIFDSNATKIDALKVFPDFINRKCWVLYPPVYTTSPFGGNFDDLKKKYSLTKPFILTLGKIEPRKNIPRLISAWKSLNYENHDLVIVGSKGWQNDSYLKNDEKIKFLGFVEDRELDGLMKLSEFFVFPSIYEGFGYPIIEAMSRGVAIACSNNSSTSEVAEDAAITFDPLNEVDIAKKINLLIENVELRKNLIAKGRERVKTFDFENFKTNLLKIIDECK